MTRTSKALKRLGVAGLAVATMAGLAALPMGTASASHTGPATRVTITPTNDTAAAGTCNLFRINAFGAGTAGEVPAEGTVVDVVVTERGTDTANTQDVDFCTAPTSLANTEAENGAAPAPTGSSITPASPNTGTGTDSGAPGTTDRAEFTTDANGQVYFGIVGTDAGVVDVQVFAERGTANNTREAAEPEATAVKNFVRGGTEAVNCVDATPETATNVVGETHTIRVLVTNNGGGTTAVQQDANPAATPGCAGETIAGVQPTAVITSSANAAGAINPTPTNAITCTQSNNDGIATCTYTGDAVRVDQIQVFVNQLDDAGGAGFAAANEPGDAVQKTWQAAPSGTLTIDVTCADEAQAGLGGGFGPGATASRTSPEDCVNALGDTDRVFTARVAPSSGTTNTAGTIIRFTVTGGSGDETITGPNTCTTANTGANPTPASECSVTVNDPTPVSGEVLTVTGTIAGTSVSDSGTLTYSGTPATARNITLTPETVTVSPSAVATLTAKVTDAAGNPVAGVTVNFNEQGVGGQNGAGFIRGCTGTNGTFTNGATSCTTNLQGIATVEVTSGTAETGSTTVTATIAAGNGSACGNAAGNPAGTTAGNCSDSSVVTFGQASPTSTSTTTTTATATSTGTTAPDCQGATGVTISVNVQRITSGNAPTLSGVVTNASGQPVAGCTLTLLAKNYIQTTYSGVQTSAPIVTDDQGRWVVVVRPERQTAYIVRVNSGGAQSRSLVIFVSARVNLNRPAAGQTLPRSFCFTGDLDPNAPDFRGAAVGLARVGRDAQGRPTFAVIGQTVTRNDANATFTVCPRSGQLASGVYVIFTSARNGLLKGSVSQTVRTA